MDKRTIFFVLSLTLTLFFVNIYFQQQNQTNLQEWSKQQKAKKNHQIAQLEEEIKSHTASLKDLPVVELYTDSEGNHFFGNGIQIAGAVITNKNKQVAVPEKIYVKKTSQGKPEELSLLSKTESEGQPLIYAAKATTIKMGNLPEYGKFDLQLVPFSKGPENISIGLAEYVDGRFSLPQKKLVQLKNEIAEGSEKGKEHTSIGQEDSIALLKTNEGYLPVGIYIQSSDSFEPLTGFNDLAPYLTKPEIKKAVTANQKEEEHFYVLENDYQQLVFSNYGGALVEINLPFQGKKDEESVVKEIEFDKEMVAKYPENAYFPSHSYYTPSNSEGQFEEHAKGKLGGYYPLLRRDLIEPNKKNSVRVTPNLYALNIVSEYPELAELVYEVKHFDKKKIVFEANQSHRKITKTFSFESGNKEAPYVINLSIKIDGDARGLWLTSGVPEVEWISGSPAPALKYRITRNGKVYVENIDPPKDILTVTSTYPDWICNSNGFLGIIMDSIGKIDSGYRVQNIPGTVLPSRLVELDKEYDRYPAKNMPGYMTSLPLNSSGGVMDFRLFAGPFSTAILKKVDEIYAIPATGYTPDYIACQSFHGWFAFISEPFAKFLFILMNFFHQWTNSWGLSIILLTIALRLMMYPLNAWSTKSMLKMQQIGPEVTAIQEKFKKDPKKAQLEIMNLYREKGVNPVSGCFPLLIQMPFLIGMFDLLKSTFELRGAGFIPGWIDNLTAPDVLFSWSTPIFFIGNQFHLLPFLLGGVMFLQQRLMSTSPKDVNLMTEQQRQQRMMGNIMSIVFTVMFYNFPSGLNIYWLSSMLLGILQQWWTQRQMKAAPVIASEITPAKVKGKK